jgi:hypothetical protein
MRAPSEKRKTVKEVPREREGGLGGGREYVSAHFLTHIFILYSTDSRFFSERKQK